jgi:hypothetical protein
MKVHLVGSPPSQPSDLARLLQAGGHLVSHSEAVPPDADVYLFLMGHEAMKELTHGLVILDLRHEPGLEAAVWAPYADLCLVHEAAARSALVGAYGCEPERVFLVADDETLPDLLDRALRDTLPPAEVERRETAMTDLPSAPIESPDPITALAIRLEVLERQTDVMQRDYQVRSRLPLVGSLVAWTRRNLTSHLREPYLDPTLERQVALNRDLVHLLHETVRLYTDLETRLARLEETGDHG